MGFVPPPAHRLPASSRAEELGNKVSTVIEEYRQHYPDLSPREVREALLRVARQGSNQPQSRVARVGVGFGAAALAAGLAGFIASASGAGGVPIVLILNVVVVLAVLGVTIAVVKDRRDRME